jgi:hypothetical protein
VAQPLCGDKTAFHIFFKVSASLEGPHWEISCCALVLGDHRGEPDTAWGVVIQPSRAKGAAYRPDKLGTHRTRSYIVPETLRFSVALTQALLRAGATRGTSRVQ